MTSDPFAWLRPLLGIAWFVFLAWLLSGCAARSQSKPAQVNFIVNPKCITKLLDCKDMDPNQCKHISLAGSNCLIPEVVQK